MKFLFGQLCLYGVLSDFMNTSSHDQHLDPYKPYLPWDPYDPFVKLLKDSPEITRYVHIYQLPVTSIPQVAARGPVEGSVFVFRKKKYPLRRSSELHLPDFQLQTTELGYVDRLMFLPSCDRCRKNKKKCSRELPECKYCVSSDELCSYSPQRLPFGRNNSIPKHSKKRKSSSFDLSTATASLSAFVDHPPSNDLDDEGISDNPKKNSSTIYQLLN